MTGATGETGSQVSAGLRARGDHVRAAGRRAGTADVRFDWYDSATHAPAIEGVERLYLVQPIGDPEPAAAVRPVLEHAVRSGLQRVVLLSSSAVEPSDHGLGGLQDAGVPAAFAEILATMDDEISRGAEDRTTDVITRVTGRAARTFEALLREEHARHPHAAGSTSPDRSQDAITFSR